MPSGGNVDATHAPVGGGWLDNICTLWRPRWLKVNNGREGSTCAHAPGQLRCHHRIDQRKASRRTTISSYHWNIICAEHWLGPSLAVVSIRSNIACKSLPKTAVFFRRLEINELIHLQMKMTEKITTQIWWFTSMRLQKQKYCELPNPSPTQRNNFNVSPNSKNKNLLGIRTGSSAPVADGTYLEFSRSSERTMQRVVWGAGIWPARLSHVVNEKR